MTPVETAAPPLDSPLAAMAPPTLPAAWVAPLEAQMTRDEQLLAALEIDLDAGLRFASGIVVVTSDRLLVMSADDGQWRSWAYRPGLSLSRRDHSGVGSLELCDGQSRLGHWRY
ncbi:MAG TPA: ABC transporter, partial [Accumulibacter sp.]|nr:ABC transporter [Accumulibacter sp.]